MKKKKFKKVCVICKENFIGNSPTSKYCQNCKLKYLDKIVEERRNKYWEEKGKIRNKIGRTLVRILREKGYEHEQMMEYCRKAKVIHS